MPSQLTYVIVSYNTVDLLSECLHSIAQHTGFCHHVIVVDNASQDGTPEMVRRDFPDIELQANTENVGFPRGVNQGLQSVESPYVFILNGDLRLTENTIAPLLARMQSNPHIGIVAPKQFYPDGTPLLSTHNNPSLAREGLRHLLFADVLRYRFQGQKLANAINEPTKVDWVMGAALFTRREMITDIGLMDETVFMYGEEFDWQYRANKANWQVEFIPESTVIHHKSASADQEFNIRRLSIVTKSNFYFFGKHFGRIRLPIFMALQVIGSLLRGLLALFATIFGRKSAASHAFEHWLTLKMTLNPATWRWLHHSLRNAERCND